MFQHGKRVDRGCVSYSVEVQGHPAEPRERPRFVENRDLGHMVPVCLYREQSWQPLQPVKGRELVAFNTQRLQLDERF